MPKRKLLYYSLRFLAVFLSIFFLWTAYLYLSAPVERLRGVVTYTPPGATIARTAGLGKPGNLTLLEMPTDLILATMIGEDREYPSHYGIRPTIIYEAVERYVKKGERLQGTSSLTQQLVKNVFTGAERSFTRKYIEMIYALRMERLFSKEEILTLYANIAQTGPGVYGYKEAAEFYFGKQPKDLSMIESAFIVSILQLPDKYPLPLLERRLTVKDCFRIRFILARLLAMKRNDPNLKTLTPNQKESIFADYLEKRPVDLLFAPKQKPILAQADRMIREFVDIYGKAQ